MVRAVCLVIAASLSVSAPAWAQPELRSKAAPDMFTTHAKGPQFPPLMLP